MAGETWTNEENNILKKYYSQHGADIVSKKLDKRTRTAVIGQASRLGIPSGRFIREEEIEYLKEYYIRGNKEDIEDKLGKSWGTIKALAFRLGIKRDVSFFLKEANKKRFGRKRSRVFVKNKLINERGKICEHKMCTWTQTIEPHHLDGDTSNNKDSNLMLLCPNHHSVTDNHAHQGNNGWKK